MKPKKTQTIRVKESIHKLAKITAINRGLQLQELVELSLKKECEIK